MRLKDISILSPQYTGKDLDTEVSFVPMESLRCGSIEARSISFREAKGKYTYFANGDLLIAKVTPCFENGNIAVAKNLNEGIGFGSSEIFVLRMSDSVNVDYMFYLTLTSDFKGKACSTMCGVGGLKRISPLFMRTYEWNLPDLEEQKKQVHYLNKQSITIDQRISLLTKKRDCYSRLKSSIINRAVTRGLTPAVSFKDSGIEWIGRIPEHWEVKRFKEIFEEKVTLSETGMEDLLSVSEYYGVAKRKEKMDVDDVYESRAESLVGYKKCYKGDLIVNIMLAWKRGLGISDYDGIVSPSYAVYRGVKIVPHYYHYLLRTGIYIKEFKRNSKGIIDSRLRLYSDRFYNIMGLYPPLSEQQAIATYLDEKCAKIDAAVANIEKQIDAMKRLKRALINEVVTGKREV